MLATLALVRLLVGLGSVGPGAVVLEVKGAPGLRFNAALFTRASSCGSSRNAALANDLLEISLGVDLHVLDDDAHTRDRAGALVRSLGDALNSVGPYANLPSKSYSGRGRVTTARNTTFGMRDLWKIRAGIGIEYVPSAFGNTRTAVPSTQWKNHF